MPNNFFFVILFLLLILTWGGPSRAQVPPQKTQQDTQGKEAAAQPEAPKPVVKIVLENNLLSVELVNANMEEIIQAIAHRAGFSVEGGSSALSKKLTTRFSNLDVDRGIIRLFSLAKETNYLISYDTKGAVSKLEIYGAAVAAKTPTAGTQASPARRQVSPTSQPPSSRPVITRPLPPSARPAPQVRPLRPAPQAPYVRPVPQSPQTSMPPGAGTSAPEPPPSQVLQEEQHTEEPMPSEDIKEIPYVSPQRRPVYIPPIRH